MPGFLFPHFGPALPLVGGPTFVLTGPVLPGTQDRL